jgi:hypothetical protein
MTEQNLNTEPSNSTKPVLAVVLFNNENKLKELDYERRFYENFYQFNKTTDLGKIYRQTELKIRICSRLLKYC